MNILEKLEKANSYISFNLFAICGWLYLPILIDFINNHEYGGYMLFVGLFLTIPWIITLLAFVILLIEIIITRRNTNNFFVKNKGFKIFKYIGLMITLFFYLMLVILIV